MASSSSNILEQWRDSRTGAWAGRGFHFQHLFVVYLLVRQWSGIDPAGAVTPEGLEDCVIELPEREIWIQLKSRKSGSFSEGELEGIFQSLEAKASSLDDGKLRELRIVHEQSGDQGEIKPVETLYDSSARASIGIRSLSEAIIELLARQLKVASIIAEGIAHEIYVLVAETSEQNADVAFPDRRRLSVNDIERRIFDRLTAEDPTAIQAALASGSLKPIDFVTPVEEPNFYLGVKVRPGHLAAGLVAERPDEIASAVDILLKHRNVLLSGPSGAGKSASMWLIARELESEFRWFETGAAANIDDAGDIVRFVMARRPTASSPIAIVFDDVGKSGADMWDVLVREFRGTPHVYLLGAIRQEDVSMITGRAETEFIPVRLQETLAEFVWEKLSRTGDTQWTHWREPFEQSEGLMLEYTHLLTQGRRLVDVIEEQVQLRETEGRVDELAIIRTSSVLCALGGEIRTSALFVLLDIPAERARPALRRLIDEHLVREDRPGVLGGLHQLRSATLRDASHDEAAYLKEKSLWEGLPATTSDTLPHVVQALLSDEEADRPAVLQHLADLLASSDDPDIWVSVLTGLGLATLVLRADALIASLEQNGVQRAQWNLAAMFSDPELELPALTGQETWSSMREAVLSFRAQPGEDLRTACLTMMSGQPEISLEGDPIAANRLLSCLAPLGGGAPVPLAIRNEFAASADHSVEDIAALLGTARYIDADLCNELVEEYGGEQALLSRYASSKPWLDSPAIEDNEHGRTVRANLYLVREDPERDLNERVCRICETLIALSPRSEAAASQPVTPDGDPIEIEGMALHAKNMPRRNLPAKTRVAWNVAFTQIFLARAAQDSLTYYVGEMSELTKYTEKLFRKFSERWIKGSSIANRDVLANEVKELCASISALAYAAPGKPSHLMTDPADNTRSDDTLGGLLTGVLGNLIRKMCQMPAATGGKAIATFTGGLSAQAVEHKNSEIWRVVDTPPIAGLSALAERLLQVSHILHEMAYDPEPATINSIVRAAKKGRMGKAVLAAGTLCHRNAERRLQERLAAIETAATERGWSVRCYTRPVENLDSIYWPPLDIAVVVEVSDFEIDSAALLDCLDIASDQLGRDFRFRVVPSLNGMLIPALAMQVTTMGPVPDFNFSTAWDGVIDQPTAPSEGADAFDRAVNACNELSSLFSCRDPNALLAEETVLRDGAITSFDQARLVISWFAEQNSDEFAFAAQFLDDCWQRVSDEAEAASRGTAVSQPLWREAFDLLNGQENEWSGQLSGLRILLRQAEAQLDSQTTK